MTSILACDLHQRVPLLAEQFRKADPFPHVLIKNFVEPSFLDRLIREFPAFDHGKALNEYGEVGSKAVHENLAPLGEAYRQLDELFASPHLLGLISGITGIPNLLYDPEYVGGGTHDNRHGQELDPHVDFNFHPTNRWYRRLNLILFLNEEWRAEWGGSLQVHSDPWGTEPAGSREVVFAVGESLRSLRDIGGLLARVPEDRLAGEQEGSLAPLDRGVFLYEIAPKRADGAGPQHGLCTATSAGQVSRRTQVEQ